MGLTIHYKFKAKGNPVILLEKLRQKAMDLPFERVDEEITHLTVSMCQRGAAYYRGRSEAITGMLLDCSASVGLPWRKVQRSWVHVDPIEAYVFNTVPGPGSEWATFGLARYPATIEVQHTWKNDDKFTKVCKDGGSTWWKFDYHKWHRHCEKMEKKGLDVNWAGYEVPDTRTIRTGLGSVWQFSAFCKTQYASDPECGGIPNFVRCHLNVIRMLEHARELGIDVHIDDEGHFAESNYSDDYKEAYASGRQPTYVDHPATHSIKTLVENVGEYNVMIAGMCGMLKGAAGAHGMDMVSPITDFQNYEHLEADFHVKHGDEFDKVIKAFGQMANSKSA